MIWLNNYVNEHPKSRQSKYSKIIGTSLILWSIFIGIDYKHWTFSEFVTLFRLRGEISSFMPINPHSENHVSLFVLFGHKSAFFIIIIIIWICCKIGGRHLLKKKWFAVFIYAQSSFTFSYYIRNVAACCLSGSGELPLICRLINAAYLPLDKCRLFAA